ncbi:MAG TPA: hypothetical protein VL563_01120 [Gemmatimonadales bacterium]|jgi:hypothetical protein|nr:hypothetical protein [Gemmatimonadales bacterium]
MSKRKPHNDVAGYVAELRCTLGGHVVIYDRARGADWIAGDERWVVMHEPSSLHVCVTSIAVARSIMKGVAAATTRDEACYHADILPEPEESRA